MLLLLLLHFYAFSQQQGSVIGTVTDGKTREPLVGVTIQAEGTPGGTTTDVDGKYRFELPVGSYNIKATFVGYIPLTKFNVVLTSGNAQQINFELIEETIQLEAATVILNRSISVATAETPNSVQKLTTEEIKDNPGGNFDISRVIQVLPGVGGTAGSVGGFRNDLIIRGGGPNENVFYLNGIEIPVINHFATQGSSVEFAAFAGFDLRIDKKWNAKRYSVNAFIDIQNLFLTKNPAFPQFTFARTDDNSGFQTTDGGTLQPNGGNAIPLILRNEDATVTPALGLVVEF